MLAETVTETKSENQFGGTWYICVAFGSWGRGRTIEEAKANCKKEGGTKAMKRYYVKKYEQRDDAPSAPWVDDYGGTNFYNRDNAEILGGEEVERFPKK